GEYALVLVNSMVRHEFATDDDYNQRRKSCESVAKMLNESYGKIPSLRYATKDQLEGVRAWLNPVDAQRAEYVLEENERVLQVVNALEEREMGILSDVYYQAQKGMKEKYEITVPEIDFLADFVNSHRFGLASRRMGGGFGGCT